MSLRTLGIDTVNLNAQGVAVPQLIIAGGRTTYAYLYFRRYRDLGAPWAFVVQNKSPHCCTANAKSLMLPVHNSSHPLNPVRAYYHHQSKKYRRRYEETDDYRADVYSSKENYNRHQRCQESNRKDLQVPCARSIPQFGSGTFLLNHLSMRPLQPSLDMATA